MPVDAEPVFRCAYRLGRVAEDVRTAAARTAGCYPEDWRGAAGIAYQQRLDATADRVRRTAVAYDAASAALVPYAQALLDVAQLEQQASGLLAQAEEADRRNAGLVGPSQGEGFRAMAERVRAEAAEVERRAAAVCAAALDAEAGRAPAPTGWQKTDRVLGDLMQYGAQTVAGTFSLLGSAWHALPGVGSAHSRHEARHELAESAVAAAQIWQIPIDMRNDMQDGRYGLAMGAAAGFFGPGKLSKFDRQLRRDVALCEKEAYREADRRALLAGREPYPVTVEQLARGEVDLVNEELRGGHAIERHVAASHRFLRLRVLTGTARAGTFRDLATAERLVNVVLEQNRDRLPEVYALEPGRTLPLLSRFDFVTGRVNVTGSARTAPVRAVKVVLDLEGGQPRVLTAYPEL